MSKSNKMLEIMKDENIKYILDSDNKLYLLSSSEARNNLIDVDSEEFKESCFRLYFEKERDTISETAYRQALSTLKGIKRAQIKERVTLYNRVARDKNSIWHYVSNDCAVRITKAGIEIFDKVPILFKLFPHQSSLPAPIMRNGKSYAENLDLIFKYVNIKDPRQRLLFKTSLVFALIPEFPHPIDLIVGPPGSSKTTATLIKKSLIDPVEDLKGFSVPRSEGDFLLMASQHHVVPFDNMPLINNWQSDMFCKAVTGDATTRRKLYTDNTQLLYRVKCCLVLNGLHMPTNRSDFLDRCLLYQLERVKPSERKEEYALMSELNKDKPIILGAMYQTLSKAMEIHEALKIDELPRMADFAKWGSAISIALGYDKKYFMDAYMSNRKSISEEIGESNSLISTVVSYVNSARESEIMETPKDLHTNLIRHANTNKITLTGLPVNETWLSRSLKEVAHILEEEGIEVVVPYKKDGKRYIKLRKIASCRPSSDGLRKIVTPIHMKDRIAGIEAAVS